MDFLTLCNTVIMHPQRKRKFFTDLAHLLGEEPPDIYPLHSGFFGPELPNEHQLARDAEGKSATETISVPSNSVAGDSFELVEFGNPTTRSSSFGSIGTSQQSLYNESSMASSFLFLPHDNDNRGIDSRDNKHLLFDSDSETKDKSANLAIQCENLSATTLVNSGIVSEKPFTHVYLELTDYYDADRMPMLLFCLQALDEFIAHNGWLAQQRWRVLACKLARRIFTAMWEVDVLDMTSSENDIVLAEYVAKKMVVPGVAHDVWCIIALYWDKYKHNYLHQHELRFGDALEGSFTRSSSKWNSVRALLNIYGMKPNQALHLVEQHDCNYLDLCKLTVEQLLAVVPGLSSIKQWRVGVEYLQCKSPAFSNSDNNSVSIMQRSMISQRDGKKAFNAIFIHLEKWNKRVQVYPCGSFSRGAAFISVLDILVALPSSDKNSNVESDEKFFNVVVDALVAASVIQKGAIHQLTSTRGACVVPFRNSLILLDLKVYSPPKSWFALLYFTGPEEFVINFYTSLLKRSLREIADTSFEFIYSGVTKVIGHKRLRAIASEKDLFDLIDRDYLQPTERI
ncbi:hypothetical protein PsorP6_002074 [Peronosclerospora sorghi]|uniref:Uncharacterized protein n=1 Tax=Peronosclerospora sorghi TaxID=230839 RepID=A0ACC0WYN6_9STRA|nr:hypothetical protein PsorP6_002074 [Peronosclerospora sorghi]